MNRTIKLKFGSKAKAVIAALLCAIYLLCFATVGYATTGTTKVHVAGTVKVKAIKAEITQYSGIDIANSSATAENDKINIDIKGLNCPGAYAVIHVTTQNVGTLNATLTDIAKKTSDVYYIETEMADVPLGEVLAPDEICTWDILVRWNPAYDDITEANDSTDFEFVLTYENNDYYTPSGGDGNKTDSPDTGDDMSYGIYALTAVIAAIIMVTCLIFIIFGKKKKEADEEC